MPSNEQWIKQHADKLEKLNKLNTNQQTFMELAGKSKRTALEQKLFKNALDMEQAVAKMEKLRAQSAMLKSTTKKAARKARDHELYNSAGLLIMADLVNTTTGQPMIDKAELLGALMGLAKVSSDDPRRKEWKRVGQEKLDSTSKPAKTKKTEAEPA